MGNSEYRSRGIHELTNAERTSPLEYGAVSIAVDFDISVTKHQCFGFFDKTKLREVSQDMLGEFAFT